MLVTKGREYIIAVVFLGLFVIFWSYLSKPGLISRVVRAFRLEDLRTPVGMLFHPAHTWAMASGDRGLFIGIDDFLGKVSGAIEKVMTPKVGSQIRAGDPLFSLAVGTKRLEVPSPISGTITRHNKRILKKSAVAAPGSEQKEWLVEIDSPDGVESIPGMRTSETARQWFEKEVGRLGKFLDGWTGPMSAIGVNLADGGDPIEGLLKNLSDEGVKEFEQLFLKTSPPLTEEEN
ncbi:hypothetical protein ACFLT7_04135 [candidate division KSB1 bacterium]